MASYATVASPLAFEDEPTRGSRFLALLEPVEDEAGALAHLEQCRASWPDATHHCWAFSLADGRTRSSDDGEPGGSAGRPILAQIAGHGVTNVSIVVVRWYGGTKLGVGGLIRAYGGAAGRALDRAEVIEVVPFHTVTVSYAYDDTGAVQGVIAARDVEVIGTRWAEDVCLTLRVREDVVDAVCQALTDRTAGRVHIERSEG